MHIYLITDVAGVVVAVVVDILGAVDGVSVAVVILVVEVVLVLL
jgi:hypothetical protein